MAERDGLKAEVVESRRATVLHEDEIRSLRGQQKELRREVAVLQRQVIDLREENRLLTTQLAQERALAR